MIWAEKNKEEDKKKGRKMKKRIKINYYSSRKNEGDKEEDEEKNKGRKMRRLECKDEAKK